MMRPLAALLILLLAGIFAISGCGNSDTIAPPPEPDPDGIVENPFAAAVVGTDSTLEVVTWNLEHFAKSGDATVEYVIQVIEGLDVDVIALQEIESSMRFENVVAGLDGYEGFRATSASYELNLAIIYRSDDSLTMSSIYEIHTNDWREFPRNPLVMEFVFNDAEFVLINNHLKCCGDSVIEENDSSDETTRRRNANLLLESTIDELYPDRRVIVLGDFNDELQDYPSGNVFQNFIDAPDKWRFVDMEIAQGPATGWSFPNWPSHLDHILITEPLFDAHDGSEALVQVVPLHHYMSGGLSDFDNYISDHLPVVLRLKP